MDENRVEGTVRRRGAGRHWAPHRHARTRAEGTAQDLYGQAADSARESALTLGSRLRRAIEPHTMHRP